MKNNQKQNGMQKKLTEKEALKFLAEGKPRAKGTSTPLNRTARANKKVAKKNKKIKDHKENVMKPDDVLIANICGKRIVLDEVKRKEIIEFILSLSEEAEEKEKEKKEERKVKSEEAEDPEMKLRDAVYQKLWYHVYLSPIETIKRIAFILSTGR